MGQVSIKSIEKAIQKVDNLDDDALERVSETHSIAQPTLLGYIMSAALEYNNEKLEGLLLYYYCLIAESFAQEGLVTTTVTDDDIDAFEEPYFEMLDGYFDDNDEEILESFTDQPELSRFIAMELSEPDDDGTELDDETATQLFIVMIAFTTLLSRSVK
ncbi:MAG: hypothetical protein PHQ74_14265 [Crocinitomicaceae bacterium]|nr:hypothetical protein [Crocinitomicaceae bacterium]